MAWIDKLLKLAGKENFKLDPEISNGWHALSLWWFDELDGRGPNTLYDNLPTQSPRLTTHPK